MFDRVKEYLSTQLGSEAKIDVLVITHPDKDHYLLLPKALTGIPIAKILLTDKDAEYDKGDVDDWLRSLKGHKEILGADYFNMPDEPSDFFSSSSVQFYVLAANSEGTFSKVNAKSIVLMVSFKEFDLLLTGDATTDTEAVILDRYDKDWLDVEVLKIGHHGSETTSTSPNWARTTRPEAATVSCGFKNSFAHPRRAVVQRLEPFTMDLKSGHTFRWGFNPDGPKKVAFEDFEDYRESIYSTASSGDLVLRSDGANFKIEAGGKSDAFDESPISAHVAAVANTEGAEQVEYDGREC